MPPQINLGIYVLYSQSSYGHVYGHVSACMYVHNIDVEARRGCQNLGSRVPMCLQGTESGSSARVARALDV